MGCSCSNYPKGIKRPLLHKSFNSEVNIDNLIIPHIKTSSSKIKFKKGKSRLEATFNLEDKGPTIDYHQGKVGNNEKNIMTIKKGKVKLAPLITKKRSGMIFSSKNNQEFEFNNNQLKYNIENFKNFQRITPDKYFKVGYKNRIVLNKRSFDTKEKANNNKTNLFLISKKGNESYINIKENFYIIVPIFHFNNIDFKNKQRAFDNFSLNALNNSLKIIFVECSFGNIPFQFTKSNEPFNIQINYNSMIMNKENLINLIVRVLPSDWKYVAWIDPEVCLEEFDWVRKAIDLLQNNDIIQLYSVANFRHFDNSIIYSQKSFIKTYKTKNKDLAKLKYQELFHDYGNTGLAWAATRNFFEKNGFLYDKSITGSGDIIIAYSLINEVSQIPIVLKGKEFKESIERWANKLNSCNFSFSCLESTINILPISELSKGIIADVVLYKNNFDPFVDLSYNDNGLIQLGNSNSKISKELNKYIKGSEEN